MDLEELLPRRQFPQSHLWGEGPKPPETQNILTLMPEPCTLENLTLTSAIP